MYRQIQSHPNSNKPVSLQMSSFVCVVICSISSCSCPFPLVIDTSFLPMIPVPSPWFSYVYTEKKQNLHVLSFSFSLLRCRWTTNCCEYHPTALWSEFYFPHLNIPAPIKSNFSMDFTPLFCTRKRKPLSNDNHKSMYWHRIECSL